MTLCDKRIRDTRSGAVLRKAAPFLVMFWVFLSQAIIPLVHLGEMDSEIRCDLTRENWGDPASVFPGLGHGRARALSTEHRGPTPASHDPAHCPICLQLLQPPVGLSPSSSIKITRPAKLSSVWQEPVSLAVTRDTPPSDSRAPPLAA